MLQSIRNVVRAVAAAAIALLLVSCGGSNDSPAPVPLFQTTVVVGASGTDNGNRCGLAADPLCFPTPAYAGTSTAANGPLFDEILAARYGNPLVASSKGGFNYAIGGATTGVIPTDTVPQKIPHMQLQVESFLQRVGFQANPQYLYIVDGTTFGKPAGSPGLVVWQRSQSVRGLSATFLAASTSPAACFPSGPWQASQCTLACRASLRASPTSE